MAARASTHKRRNRVVILAGAAAVLVLAGISAVRLASQTATPSPASIRPAPEGALAIASAIAPAALPGVREPVPLAPEPEPEPQASAPRPGHDWAGTFLAGRVVCALGELPLAAHVQVLNAGGSVASTQSTPLDGLFELRLGTLRAAGLRLAVAAPGFERAELELDAEALRGNEAWPGEVRLGPAGGWSLQARDVEGAPVVGARVLGWSADGNELDGTPPRELGHTGADGSLELPSGAFARFIVHQGTRSALVPGQTWPGAMGAVLLEGARLVVHEGPGPGAAPARELRLLLNLRERSGPDSRVLALLDADGELPWPLPPGEWIAYVGARGFASSQDAYGNEHSRFARLTVQGGEPIELVLGPAKVPWPLSAVEEESGRALPEFSAWIEEGDAAHRLGEQGAMQGPIQEARGGTIDLTELIGRSYSPHKPVLAAVAPGRRVVRRELALLRAGAPVELRIPRAPEGWLRLLTHAGAPWREPVTLRQYPAGRVLLSGRAAPDGRFGPFPVDGEELVLREGNDPLGREVGRHSLGALARFGGTLTVRLSPRTARIEIVPASGTDALPADARIFLLDEGGQWRAARREGGGLLFEALNPGRYTVGPSEALAAISAHELRSLPIVLADGQALELPFDPAWLPAPAHLQVILLEGGPPASELRLAEPSGSMRLLSPTRSDANRAYFALAPGSQGQGLIVLHPPSDEAFGRRILAEGPRGAPIVLSAGQLVLEVALAGAAAELDPPPRLGPLAQLLATSKPRLAAAAAAPNAQAFDAFRFIDGPGVVDLGWFPAGELTLLARCLRAPGVAASAGERRSFVTQELDLTLAPGESRRVRIELELE